MEMVGERVEARRVFRGDCPAEICKVTSCERSDPEECLKQCMYSTIKGDNDKGAKALNGFVVAQIQIHQSVLDQIDLVEAGDVDRYSTIFLESSVGIDERAVLFKQGAA